MNAAAVNASRSLPYRVYAYHAAKAPTHEATLTARDAMICGAYARNVELREACRQ